MGIKSAQNVSLLILIIMSKLLPEIWLRFAQDTNKEVWEIEELMEMVRKEVEVRELILLSSMESNNPRHSIPLTPSTFALLSTNSSIKCVYCGN